MALYFFHIVGERRYNDTDGVELADLAAAKKEALKIISELITGDALGDIWLAGEWIMTVVDETARELFSVRISTSQRNGVGAG